jgi:hypothetical protein
MKSVVCYVLSSVILAVVLQCRQTLACVGSVCQLHQLQINGTGVFLLAGQVRYIPPNSPTSGVSVTSFNKTYNFHIHSPVDNGLHHSAFLKIVDKHYVKIYTPQFENGECSWSNMNKVATDNARTNLEISMENVLMQIVSNIRRVQTDGTRLIFRGKNVSNLVCNRVPAL